MEHHIYWWNLENLFDVEKSPRRPEWLEKQIGKELVGWTSAVLDQKIANLCSVLKKLNNGLGPDILGVCEIENEEVVKRLMDKLGTALGRNYKILHKDTKDQRGIDIAIIYDRKKYKDDGRMFSLEVMKRNATRDLFQVTLKTKKGNELVIIGNHWPARLGGQYESEPYRIMVAEVLSYWIERIHDVKKVAGIERPSIICMGDFNDNPYDRSMTAYLQGTANLQVVKNARGHFLYNPMFSFLDEEVGTHVFNNEVNVLDQFLLSKALAFDHEKHPFVMKSVNITHFPEMISGDYNTPIRFSRPVEATSFNPLGFSDHLPIEMIIEEKL
jgi:predicted extracellular nuclease